MRRTALVLAAAAALLLAASVRILPSSGLALRVNQLTGARALLRGAVTLAPRGLYRLEPVADPRTVSGTIAAAGQDVPVVAVLSPALDAEALAALLEADPAQWLLDEQVLAELERGLAAASPSGDWRFSAAAAARALERRLMAERLDRLTVGDRDSGHGFASEAERAALPPHGGAAPVLLVGLDGADWSVLDPLMYTGQTPHLAGLVRDGARAVLRGQRPLLSPLLWTTMATGVDPYVHGIKDFVTGGAPISSAERRVPAFWNRLSAQGVESTTVAWWATWPAEWVRGSLVSDRVAYSLFAAGRPEHGLAHPAAFEPEAARIAAAIQIPDELLARFVRLTPRRLAEARRMEQAGDLGDPVAHLIRTLRGMLTYHRLALDLIERRPAPVTAVYYQAIDEVGHRFVAARPPALPGHEAREAAEGGAVDAVYRYQDELLGELWSRFRARHGDRARVIVVSDHGFYMGADRPRDVDPFDARTASLWHRADGIFLASGPGISRRELPALDQLQVLPILMAAAGLPGDSGLPGQVPEGLFDAAPPAPVEWPQLSVQRIPPPVPEDGTAEQVDAARLEELHRLGYIGDEQGSGPSVNAVLVDALHFQRAGQKEEALRLLQKALPETDHDETLAATAVSLALELKRHDLAAGILDEMSRRGQAPEMLPVLQVQAWQGLGVSSEAIRQRLEAQRQRNPFPVALALYDLAVESGDPVAVVEALRGALALEPESPLLGPRLEKLPEPALPEALDAVLAAYRERPRAVHLGRWLGRKLDEARRWGDSVEVYRRLLQSEPANRQYVERWAMASMLQGSVAPAIRELESVGAAGAHTQGTRAVLATAYAVSGRADEAIELYEGLLRDEPGRLEFYRPLAELLMQRGRPQDALQWLDRGLALPGAEPMRPALEEARSRAAAQTGATPR